MERIQVYDGGPGRNIDVALGNAMWPDGHISFTGASSVLGYNFQGQRINPRQVRMYGDGIVNLGARKFDAALAYLADNAEPILGGGGSPEDEFGRTMFYHLPVDGNKVEVGVTLKNMGRAKKGFPGLVGIPRTFGDVTFSVAGPYSAYFGEKGKEIYPGSMGDHFNPEYFLLVSPIRERMNYATNVASMAAREIEKRLPEGFTRDEYQELANGWRGL